MEAGFASASALLAAEAYERRQAERDAATEAELAALFAWEDDPTLVDVHEAAEISGVKPGTIRVWCTRGKLDVARYEPSPGNGQPLALYLRADVEALAR